MTDALHLDRLTDAAAADDGKTVRFAIRSRDGRSFDVACDYGDIEKIIQFLIQLGQLSADRRTQVTPHRFGHSDNVTVSPIGVSDLGLMRGMESDEVVLITRMSGFDLGFSANPFHLRALYKEIERVVPRAVLNADDHHHGEGGHDHGHGHHHNHGHDHDHDHHH